MYGDDLLGDEIARNWLKTVNQFYLEQHKLIEKYHIADGVSSRGGGGGIRCRDGFGWTNGCGCAVLIGGCRPLAPPFGLAKVLWFLSIAAPTERQTIATVSPQYHRQYISRRFVLFQIELNSSSAGAATS